MASKKKENNKSFFVVNGKISKPTPQWDGGLKTLKAEGNFRPITKLFTKKYVHILPGQCGYTPLVQNNSFVVWCKKNEKFGEYNLLPYTNSP